MLRIVVTVLPNDLSAGMRRAACIVRWRKPLVLSAAASDEVARRLLYLHVSLGLASVASPNIPIWDLRQAHAASQDACMPWANGEGKVYRTVRPLPTTAC